MATALPDNHEAMPLEGCEQMIRGNRWQFRAHAEMRTFAAATS